MSPAALAWRSLAHRPARSALGIAGVATVGALLLDMLLLSRGLVVSFRDLLDSTGFDVRVMATEDLPGIGPPIRDAEAVAASLRSLPQVAEVVALRFAAGEALAAGGEAFQIHLFGADPGARRTWTILRGEPTLHRMDGGAPIVLNRGLARALRLSPGDAVRIRPDCGREAAALPPVEFRVTGIVELVFDAPEDLTAVTALPDLARACGEEGGGRADFLMVASSPKAGADAAVAAIRRLRPDLHAYSNVHLVERFRRTDFSYFRQISFVLSTITLFFAFLLVATLLTVSVNQRLGEIAALRAIGFSRRRVTVELLWESGMLVGAGGLLSLPLGALLAVQLDGILRAMPDIPERLHFFVFEPRTFLAHLALLLFTTAAAASYPVALASRLPIAGTLRKEVVG